LAPDLHFQLAGSASLELGTRLRLQAERRSGNKNVFKTCGLFYKNMTIVNDALILVSEGHHNLEHH
jgi:hypothetical protein